MISAPGNYMKFISRLGPPHNSGQSDPIPRAALIVNVHLYIAADHKTWTYQPVICLQSQ